MNQSLYYDLTLDFDEMTYRIDKTDKSILTTSATMTFIKETHENLEDVLLTNDNWCSLYGRSTPDEVLFKITTSSITHSWGDLLFDLVKSDFETPKGFIGFTEKWGFSGLVALNNKPIFPTNVPKELNLMQAVKFYQLLFDAVHQDLIEVQSHFKRAVAYTVDNKTNSNLSELTPLEQYYYTVEIGGISSLEQYNKPIKTTYRPTQSYKKIVEELLTSRHKEDSNKNSLASDRPSNHTDRPSFAIEFSNRVRTNNIKILKNCSSFDIRSLAYLEFFDLLNSSPIYICSNCNNYFVPMNKSDEIYCENCRSIGYINKIKNDPILKAYNTAYKSRHREKQRKVKALEEQNANIELKNEWIKALEKWMEIAKEKRNLAYNGGQDLKDFNKFIENKLEDIINDSH